MCYNAKMLSRLFAISFLLLTGCSLAEADEPLPNGYRFVEVSKGNGMIITDDGEIAVYPNVVEYRLNGSLVVGRRELATDNTDYSQPFVKGLGSFVFDTSTGRLMQGLSQAEIE